jgi:hypothetical protein
MHVKGFGAAETGSAFAGALELWERLGSPSQYPHIPYGHSRYYAACGKFDVVESLDRDLLRLSRRRNDNGGLVLGHLTSGRNLGMVGKFASSRKHLEEVLALYDPTSHSSLIHQAAFHPRVNSQGFLGIVLFCLGFPDQALERSEAAVLEVGKLAHPLSSLGTWHLRAVLLSLDRDKPALDNTRKSSWQGQSSRVCPSGVRWVRFFVAG